jgi:DNA-binding response OmpR family regulator
MIEQTEKSPMQDKKRLPIKENILVIQPDLSERKIVQLVFNKKYNLCFADDVDTAIRTGRDFPCKVMVFDAGIVVQHTLDEVSRLKAANQVESPIILLASNNTFEIEKKIAAIGVFYHLVRPYSVIDLENLIEAALRYWQRTFGWTNAGDKA